MSKPAFLKIFRIGSESGLKDFLLKKFRDVHIENIDHEENYQMTRRLSLLNNLTMVI